MADATQPYKQNASRKAGQSPGKDKTQQRPRTTDGQGSFTRLCQVAKKITQAELDAQLDRLNIPRPDDELDMPPILRDGIFPYIGELLRQYGQGEWALRPRTFCILRMLGCSEVMNAFVTLRRTDAFLPYSARNLPNAIQGAEIRAKFLRLQELVLSGQNLGDLEKEGGAHVSFHSPADDYFSCIELLGQGGTGKVDRVWGPFSLKYFARKRIHRGISALRDEKALTTFLNELKILKTASHRHLVKLISSYTDPVYVGLIMTPVAEEDLKSYLRKAPRSDVERNARKQCLQTFFGCLTKALEYLHINRIDHKDIKPQNVLVKNAKIYLTDFGTAKVHRETSRSQSTGEMLEWTPKYCAPEIANQNPHGKPSDIWSMGCVFIEMAAVLNDHTLDEMENFYTTHGTNMTAFHMNEEATSEWLVRLETSPDHNDLESLTWIRAMLQKVPSARPTASQVIAQIVDSQKERRFFCFQCFEADHGMDELEDTGTDFVTDTALQTHAQHHYTDKDTVDDSDDTVTAQFLEEVGAVMVASDKEVPFERSDGQVPDSEVHSAQERGTATHDTPKQAKVRDEWYSASSKTQPAPSSASTPVDTRDRSVNERSSPNMNPDTDREVHGSGPRSQQGKKVTFQSDTDVEVTNQLSDFSNTKRFSGLPADRRPRPSEFEPMAVALDDQPVIAPDPIQPPPLYLEDCYPLPKATLAPSYILAGANRFSKREVWASERAAGSLNLFVYGRLMFPSVYRGFAARSMQGVYSPMHQRRLIPSSMDWSRADTSIKRAAEVMTPARLRDFDVWRPSGCTFAVVQESDHTNAILNLKEEKALDSVNLLPSGEVMGFLITGLTDESLRYCDLVFCSDDDKLRRANAVSERTDKDKPKASHDLPLGRRKVTVDIQLSTSEIRPVSAYTYVWTGRNAELRDTWSPDIFVRTSNVQALSEVTSVDWRVEETSLAETMKLNYALVGDEVCAAVLSGDIAGLQQQLRCQCDIDARCRRYGTPLQAAIIKGNENMTRFLLDNGANPSLSGGKYGTPLIAATMGSRKSITRLLLKRRVDVFGTDNTHVSALYQAVGHGDWAITEMLLETGAWLSKDYGEVKDLANEKGDSDMQALLREYDITGAQLAAIDAPNYRDRLSQEVHKNSRALFKSTSRMAAIITRKFITLSSEPGSWKGRKGVAVVKAALAAGASPKILEHLRTCINPVSKLIDLLKEADREHEETFRRDIHQSGHIEELDDEEENELGVENDTYDLGHLKSNTAYPNQRPADEHFPASYQSSSDSSASRARSYDSEAQVARRPKHQKHRSPSPPKSLRRDHCNENAAPSDLHRYTHWIDSPNEARSPSPPPKTEPPTWNNRRRRSVTPPLSSGHLAPYQHLYSSKRQLPTQVQPSDSVSEDRNPRYRKDVSQDFSERHISRGLEHRSYNASQESPNLDYRSQNQSRLYGDYGRDDRVRAPAPCVGSRNQPSQRGYCAKCNGVGWYREIWTDRAKYDHVREVDCGSCRGSGRLQIR